MIELKNRNCVRLAKGTPALNSQEIAEYKSLLQLHWNIKENHKLEKEFQFENFKRAIAFVQEIALIAEKENHHPDICIHYTTVIIELSTHDIGGLSENDFIMAAKIESL
jgi:4a-hydroxytetrahydrobiopterin dehydratase